MKITCLHCNINITINKSIYIMLVLATWVFYIVICAQIFLNLDHFNSHYIQIAGEKHPWKLLEKEKRLVENHLRPCPCGGNFKFDLHPRCPNCKKVLNPSSRTISIF